MSEAALILRPGVLSLQPPHGGLSSHELAARRHAGRFALAGKANFDPTNGVVPIKSFTVGQAFRIVRNSQIVPIVASRPEMPRIPVVPADSVE